MPTTLHKNTSRTSHASEPFKFYIYFVVIPCIALYWDNLYSNNWNHSLTVSSFPTAFQSSGLPVSRLVYLVCFLHYSKYNLYKSITTELCKQWCKNMIHIYTIWSSLLITYFSFYLDFLLHFTLKCLEEALKRNIFMNIRNKRWQLSGILKWLLFLNIRDLQLRMLKLHHKALQYLKNTVKKYLLFGQFDYP